MSRIPLIVLLVLCASTVSFAQSKKKQKKSQDSQQQSSSLSPYFPKEDFEPAKKGKAKKGKSKRVTYNAMDEHEDHMRAVVKANRKAEKEAMKPQYSDPTYFGHKHKPKKHKPGKMKFCKECEIRH